MSIASEITALNTNLTAAKNAVTTKGGTVGNTGLAGLASEIASIPAGGEGTWGSLTYLDSNDSERTVTIDDEDELFSLCGNNTHDVTIGGETFNTARITTVALGTNAAYVSVYFLSNCSLLTTITGVENLIYVGNYFLYNCSSLNCNLNFERLYSCGSRFMTGCTSFNGTLQIPEIHEVAAYFMNNCTSFAQTLTFPSKVTSAGNNIMYNCDSFTNLVFNCDPNNFVSHANSFATTNASAPMYTTGITVTGTYANEFKTYFPDNSSSPYRKIIVAS
jgi:hypothetical protein